MSPTPVTIITGFLGSGKTTLILNLIPQLPPAYRLALLKNEFGDVAIDSQIASSRAVSGVQELLNGCICCNLVGQLGDALETLRKDVIPDRIVIETSGSAFPATLAMEVNRLGRETGHYVLDGVVVVIDVENWKGYEDTSYTAKLQARFTDLVVLNKWEEAGERRLDDCLDRLGDLEVDVASVKSDRGRVSTEALLGLDRSLARDLVESEGDNSSGPRHPEHDSAHKGSHSDEVEVLSVTLSSQGQPSGIPSLEISKLEAFLKAAPKDEIYRIKAIFSADDDPPSTDGTAPSRTSRPLNGDDTAPSNPRSYILNWAFGRWTYTDVSTLLSFQSQSQSQLPISAPSDAATPSADLATARTILRMTLVLARNEATKWKTRLEQSQDLWLSPTRQSDQTAKDHAVPNGGPDAHDDGRAGKMHADGDVSRGVQGLLSVQRIS